MVKYERNALSDQDLEGVSGGLVINWKTAAECLAVYKEQFLADCKNLGLDGDALYNEFWGYVCAEDWSHISTWMYSCLSKNIPSVITAYSTAHM